MAFSGTLDITDAQVQQFGGAGYLTLERVVDRDTVARLRPRFDKLFAGEFETGIAPDEVNW